MFFGFDNKRRFGRRICPERRQQGCLGPEGHGVRSSELEGGARLSRTWRSGLLAERVPVARRTGQTFGNSGARQGRLHGSAAPAVRRRHASPVGWLGRRSKRGGRKRGGGAGRLAGCPAGLLRGLVAGGSRRVLGDRWRRCAQLLGGAGGVQRSGRQAGARVPGASGKRAD
ncbi:uncharacterized protein A4U43_C08F4900 [Asparagus officinalis]|nr:uncharacterized protein A4U43_C08F4900 [Asparagus officinalis]